MKYFQYTVRDVQGLTAHIAGQIVRIAKQHPDTAITVNHAQRTVNALHRMKLLGLGIKEGDLVTVCAEGPDEVEASIALRNYFQNNF